MKQSSLSILILTKNRADLLKRCLDSLTGQLGHNDEIIVIDNDSHDNTWALLAKYKQIIPVKPYKTDIRGYSQLYNFAIRKSNKKVLVFFDDDCVASKNYIDSIRIMHRLNPGILVQGNTFSIPKNNVYAQIMGDHYRNWLTINHCSKNEMKTFDNKNAFIEKSILQHYGFFSELFRGGSEDIELGQRLRQRGIKILFCKNMVAYHHERTTLKDFLRQHYRIARSERLITKEYLGTFHFGLVEKKFALHTRSAASRWMLYMRQKNYSDGIKMICAYVGLVFVRLFAYCKPL